jgi:dipeptidase D
MYIAESKAQYVWQLFQILSQIPRQSKHEAAVTKWLRTFAKQNNLSCQIDDAGTVAITIPASKGYEAAPGVILQAHTDMVCEKTPQSTHNFETDGIEWVEKEGWLYANNTTLGADNGIGVCMALAIALEENIEHPCIELLFTVDEETGLTGANKLTADFVSGSRLINLDSEDEGVLTIGCAGGSDTKIVLPIEVETIDTNHAITQINVSELIGGHSGVNIHEQRGNAIHLLSRTLTKIYQTIAFHLISITGGTAHNAIPRDAQAILTIPNEKVSDVNNMIIDMVSQLKIEFKNTDRNLSITMTDISDPFHDRVMTAKSSRNAIYLINALPHGVFRMAHELPDIVETSNNLAQVSTDIDQCTLSAYTSERSFNQFTLNHLSDKISQIANLAGARTQQHQGYPPWQPQYHSPLKSICEFVYKQYANKPPIIEVIHAGLECGVIGEKYPDMEMISFGPTIQNPHSPQERVNIESVDQVWAYLLMLLPALK